MHCKEEEGSEIGGGGDGKRADTLLNKHFFNKMHDKNVKIVFFWALFISILFAILDVEHFKIKCCVFFSPQANKMLT